MPIFTKASEIVLDNVFLNLGGFLPETTVLVKVEGFNLAGSIKLKTATSLLDNLEARGRLRRGGGVIESSSGNLGIALSLICAERGYRFICVTDPNALGGNVDLIKAYGGEVVVIRERDRNGGYLESRISYITQALQNDPSLAWPNQYANEANPEAHRDRTARAIIEEIEGLTHLFVGVGTSGTLMGCIDKVVESAPHVEVFGVDVAGSVTFGQKAGKRHIPGLGTSRRPELFDPDAKFVKVVVTEEQTVEMNRQLLQKWSFLAGGSTGSVLAGVRNAALMIPANSVVVAISPDLGERYVGTIYNDEWTRERFPCAVSSEAI